MFAAKFFRNFRKIPRNWITFFCDIDEIRSKFRKIFEIREIYSKFAKLVRKFSEICEIHSPAKSYYFCKNTIFLMLNGKISIFIERKLNEDFAKMRLKIFRENFERKWTNFVQRKFRWNPYLQNKDLKISLCACTLYRATHTGCDCKDNLKIKSFGSWLG